MDMDNGGGLILLLEIGSCELTRTRCHVVVIRASSDDHNLGDEEIVKYISERPRDHTVSIPNKDNNID